VCLFNDGNIYFDKIKKLATRNYSESEHHPRPYLIKNHIGEDSSKGLVNANIEFVFKEYLHKLQLN
jgi:hypothetical protein